MQRKKPGTCRDIYCIKGRTKRTAGPIAWSLRKKKYGGQNHTTARRIKSGYFSFYKSRLLLIAIAIRYLRTIFYIFFYWKRNNWLLLCTNRITVCVLYTASWILVFSSLQISFVTVLEYCSKQLNRKRNFLALIKVSSVNENEFYILVLIGVHASLIWVGFLYFIWRRLVTFFICSWRSKFCLFDGKNLVWTSLSNIFLQSFQLSLLRLFFITFSDGGDVTQEGLLILHSIIFY